MMQQKVGIIRRGDRLSEALSDLDGFTTRTASAYPGSSKTYNTGWHQALDLENMLIISRACALAALTREESRGGHTRDDFPVPDSGMWSHTINIIRLEHGEISIRQQEIDQPPPELEALLDRSKRQEEE